MKTIDEKDYKLWWEYLRRSENYKAVCDRIKSRKEGKSLPPPREELRRSAITFLNFGNIHSATFKQWWKWKRKRLEWVNEQKTTKKVRLFNEPKNINEHFENCIESFKDHYGKEPSLPEFKDYFSSWLNSAELYPALYLIVDVPAGKTDELIKSIKNIIIRKKKELLTKKTAFRLTRFHYPSTSVHHDALKRYLKVYDLRKQGKDWKKIMIQVNPNAHGAWEDIKRTLRMDYEKAVKIIKNVEEGFFPGPYDLTQHRRMKANR